MATTKIEWTQAVWNPVVGCSIVSPGCTNCYAMTMAARLEAIATAAMPDVEHVGMSVSAPIHYLGTTKRVNGNAVWTGKVTLAPEHILLKPLSWKKPRTIFVNSMGDLFHESIDDKAIDLVMAVIGRCKHHTFQVLTKRSVRMRAYMTELRDSGRWMTWKWEDSGTHIWDVAVARFEHAFAHLWLGVSAERQKEADERIPDLLATPAAVRFVSAEPLLGPIDFEHIRCPHSCTPPDYCNQCHPDGGEASGTIDALQRGLDWIIVGGESGHDARPMHPDWARSIRDQCAAAGVPFFFKQFGEYGLSDRGRPNAFWMGEDGYHELGVSSWDPPFARSKSISWVLIERLGKSRAGRLLDGREHNDMPGLKQIVEAAE